MLKIECEDIELSDLILRGRCTTNRLYKKLSSNASFKIDLAKVIKKMKMVDHVSELASIGLCIMSLLLETFWVTAA